MKLINCNRCGGGEFQTVNGFSVCLYCRSRFNPEAEDIPTSETTIGIASDIENLLVKCVTDPNNRRRYASLILDIDPTNQEVRKYI